MEYSTNKVLIVSLVALFLQLQVSHEQSISLSASSSVYSAAQTAAYPAVAAAVIDTPEVAPVAKASTPSMRTIVCITYNCVYVCASFDVQSEHH